MSEPKKLVELEQKYQFAIRYSLFLLTLISVYLLGQQVIDNAIYEIGAQIFDIPVTSSTALLCTISLIITASYLAHKKRKSLLVLSLYIGMPIFLWFIGQVLWFSSINTYHCSSIYFTIGAVTLVRIGCSICKLKKGASPEIERIGLAPDEPLTGEENDNDVLLGFNSIADSYKNYIIEMLYPVKRDRQKAEEPVTPSYVFGVEGSWGSGKTSFLKILKHRIEKEKGVIQVWFSPWMSSSVEILTQDFFNTLAEQIPQLRLKKEIRRYGSALSKVESKGIGTMLETLYNPVPSLQDQFDEINKAIKVHNIKIVVYIDDLDRMDAPEILAMFKLIRNTARFSNLVYLVAYDRDYVVSQLNKHFNSSGSENEMEKHKGLGNGYLEKIIQQIISLPYKNDLLSNLFRMAEYDKILASELPDELKKNIDTLRKVKRLHNQVISLRKRLNRYNSKYEIDIIIFCYFLQNEYQMVSILKEIEEEMKYINTQLFSIKDHIPLEKFKEKIQEKIKAIDENNKRDELLSICNFFTTKGDGDFSGFESQLNIFLMSNILDIDIKDQTELLNSLTEEKNGEKINMVIYKLTNTIELNPDNAIKVNEKLIPKILESENSWNNGFFINYLIKNKETGLPSEQIMEIIQRSKTINKAAYTALLYDLIATNHRSGKKPRPLPFSDEELLGKAIENLEEVIFRSEEYLTVENTYITCWKERKADSTVVIAEEAHKLLKEYIEAHFEEFFENIFRPRGLLAKPTTIVNLFPFLYEIFKGKEETKDYLKDIYTSRKTTLNSSTQKILLLTLIYIDDFSMALTSNGGFNLKSDHILVFNDENGNWRKKPSVEKLSISKLEKEAGLKKKRRQRPKNLKWQRRRFNKRDRVK